jgi:uncharacterized membrane-anchored protein
MLAANSMKERVKYLKYLMRSKGIKFWNDERGELSVKGLALAVGAIIVIGAIVIWLADPVDGPLIGASGWISDVWDKVWKWVQDNLLT